MKRTTLRLAVVMVAFGLSYLPSVPRASVLHAQDRTEVNSEGDDRDDNSENDHDRILTIDRFVPHISTAHVNQGQPVELFVRERVHRGHRGHRPVVLMVHGGTVPAVPDFDLRFRDYSWMAFLAQAGFDVFALDLQGYGLSPRPRMDDPCNTRPQDQHLLIPYPLSEPCDANYAFKMAIQSDWDEIDRVVDYLRRLRGVEKVSLIGWSRGGPRAGGYAARHAEKVDKLFLYSPAFYDRLGPSDPPPLPEPGFLMQLPTIPNLFNIVWDGQVGCENQFNAEIRGTVRSSILEFDPLGSTWGNGELWRAPLQNTLWGWNREAAAQRIGVPTLIIRGEFDNQGGPEQLQRDLFADLGTEHKVFVKVACASHYLVWENQHLILLRASDEWLRHGTFARHTNGSFFVDTEGQVHEE